MNLLIITTVEGFCTHSVYMKTSHVSLVKKQNVIACLK